MQERIAANCFLRLSALRQNCNLSPDGVPLISVDTIVRQKLRQARRRLIGEHFLALAAWALVLGFSALIILRGATLVIPKSPPWSTTTVGWIFISPLFLAAVVAIGSWWSDRRVARELDARGSTRDRFLTALDLRDADPIGLTASVQREIAHFANTFSLPQALRIRIPFRRYLWILIPLLALFGIEGMRHLRQTQIAPEQNQAKALLAAVRKAAKKHPEDKALQEEAQKLESTETQLDASREPLREALRALSDLEQSLAAPAQFTPGESKALADALSAANPQLASDLRAGNQEAAANSLSQLDPESLAKALEEAARHLEKSRLRELSRQSQQEAQTRLVKMVASAGHHNSSRSQFLAQVQDLKSGSSQAQDNAPAAPGEGEGESPPGKEKAGSGENDHAPPGGSPGSELDRGRGPELAGEADPTQKTSGPDEFLPGTSGDGASLVEIFRASGRDDPKASQAYRSAFDAAQPAALDAVNREEIPPGSRLLVRRYFEAIRPKE